MNVIGSEFWNGKTVFVSGAGGFLGGWELIATELPELKFHACSRVFEVGSAMSTSGLQ